MNRRHLTILPERGSGPFTCGNCTYFDAQRGQSKTCCRDYGVQADSRPCVWSPVFLFRYFDPVCLDTRVIIPEDTPIGELHIAQYLLTQMTRPKRGLVVGAMARFVHNGQAVEGEIVEKKGQTISLKVGDVVHRIKARSLFKPKLKS